MEVSLGRVVGSKIYVLDELPTTGTYLNGDIVILTKSPNPLYVYNNGNFIFKCNIKGADAAAYLGNINENPFEVLNSTSVLNTLKESGVYSFTYDGTPYLMLFQYTSDELWKQVIYYVNEDNKTNFFVRQYTNTSTLADNLGDGEFTPEDSPTGGIHITVSEIETIANQKKVDESLSAIQVSIGSIFDSVGKTEENINVLTDSVNNINQTIERTIMYRHNVKIYFYALNTEDDIGYARITLNNYHENTIWMDNLKDYITYEEENNQNYLEASGYLKVTNDELFMITGIKANEYTEEHYRYSLEGININTKYMTDQIAVVYKVEDNVVPVYVKLTEPK